MKKLLVFGILSFTLILGCKKSSTGPTETALPQTGVIAAGNASFLYETTFSAIDGGEVMKGANAVGNFGVGGGGQPAKVSKFYMTIQKIRHFEYLARQKQLFLKTIFIACDTTNHDTSFVLNEESFHFAKYWNPDKSSYQLIFVIRRGSASPDTAIIDSTQLQFNSNSTKCLSVDDLLTDAAFYVKFSSVSEMDEQLVTLHLSYSAGPYPTGITLTADVKFNRNSANIKRIQSNITANFTQNSFTINNTVIYFNNSQFTETVTLSAGSGTYSATYPDGTTASGTFDINTGSYSRTINFPNGNEPASIHETGLFTLTPADTTVDGTVMRIVTHTSGKTDTTMITRDEQKVNGQRVIIVTIIKSDGGNGGYSVNTSSNQVTGTWTEADGKYTEFMIDFTDNQFAHLTFTTYSRQALPRVTLATGEFTFYPDGTGEGTITIVGDKTYYITIGHDGNI